MRRSLWLAVALVGTCAIVVVFLLRSRPSHPLSPSPSLPLSPSLPPGQWPGFQGGGALLGMADDAPAPPLTLRWTHRPAKGKGASIGGSAAITLDTVLVADERGVLLALNRTDGTERWRYTAEAGFEAGPRVVGDRVFIGDLGGTFHAVTLANGQKIWTYVTELPIRGSANSADGRILFTNDGGEVVCLNTDGKLIWKKVAAEEGVDGTPVYGTVAIAGGAIYFAACDAKLRGWRLANGSQIFSADMGALSGASPTVAGDRIVVGTDQGKVQCFSFDGTRLWTYAKVEDEAMVYATAAVTDGLAVVGARDRHVHAIDLATGRRVWTFPTGGDVDGSPVISGGRVYVGSRDRRFYVLDLKKGDAIGEFTAARPIVAAPAIAGGVVVFSDIGGNVYCLQGK